MTEKLTHTHIYIYIYIYTHTHCAWSTSQGLCRNYVHVCACVHTYVLSCCSRVWLFVTPWTRAARLFNPRLPWDSPGKNTGVGCHALLQGIFLTLGSNQLLHYRQILYSWATEETYMCVCVCVCVCVCAWLLNIYKHICVYIYTQYTHTMCLGYIVRAM